MYLHELADEESSFTKEDMQVGQVPPIPERLFRYWTEIGTVHRRYQNASRIWFTASALEFEINSTVCLLLNKLIAHLWTPKIRV